MEKLLIEEKAKLYDEAIERAKIKRDEYIRLDGPKSHVPQDIEFIFPELVESEDEKIRKELIEFFNQFENGKLRGVDITPWIAWLEKQGKNDMGISEATKQKLEDSLNKALEKETPESWNESLEKQGEQKPTDKVEPKFKVGDKIIRKEFGGDFIHNPHKIIQVDILDKKYRLEGGLDAHFLEEDDWELVEQEPADNVEPKFKVDSFIVNNSRGVCQVTEIRDDEYCLYPLYGEIMGYLKIIDVDNEYHLWTIKDARDGDVLAYENDIVIFKENNYNPEDKSGCMFVYCSCNNFYEIGGINPTYYKPATKEQRELLFQKMKEAGYEWDADKRKLKKVGQSIAWSEEDEEMFDAIIADIQFTQKAHNHEVNQVVYEREIDWLESIKDRITWKPTEKQMESIARATNRCISVDDAKALLKLYEDLKKL